MKKNTRFAFNAYLQQLARLNGVAVEELSSKFTVEPSVQQTLEDQIQQSAAFLTLINVTPVTEQSGQLLGLGVGSTIAGTTDTTAKEREPVDPTLMVDVEYKCEQTNFDTVLTYAKLDLWAKFQDFQVRIRDAIVKRQALDRIMIGFNGVKRAKTSNRSENPLLQDVNKGWLQKIREDAPDHVMGSTTTGGETTPGAVKVGTAAVTRTSRALSWLAGAPLALLRRGLASSGNAAGLLTAPLSSLHRTASLTGNVLKTVAGVPVALLRSGLSGLRAVVVMFMNPLAALRGGLAAAGAVLRVLASGPLAMLRVALYAISGLLGALLSPIGLVVTALAGVALVVWKYWQPINAFLGGVVEGFKAAAGPVSAAFEPLKPVFQWIGDKVQALWGWFTDLLTPVKSTSAELQSAAAMGRRFGEALAEGLKPLPVITITRKDGDSHRFTLADRGAYTGVIASWLHTREPAKKESTTVKRKRRTKKQKKEPEAKQGDYLVGTDENVLVLNRTYANRSNAERAAKMQWERLQRGVASFSLQLAEGRADLYTEMPVKVSGFKQPIDDAEWTITTLTHTVSPDNGFTTSIELEVKIDDLEME